MVVSAMAKHEDVEEIAKDFIVMVINVCIVLVMKVFVEKVVLLSKVDRIGVIIVVIVIEDFFGKV